MRVTSTFSFSNNVSFSDRDEFLHWFVFKLQFLFGFKLDNAKMLSSGKGLTLFWYIPDSQTSPGFYVSAVQVFWKHWEQKKLLVTNNFFFSHSVFYLFGVLSAIFIKFKIVVCKLFQFERVQNLSFGKRLTTLLRNFLENIVGTGGIVNNQLFLLFLKKSFPTFCRKIQ